MGKTGFTPALKRRNDECEEKEHHSNAVENRIGGLRAEELEPEPV